MRVGLAVGLVDKGDFGSATSSASSKLIHGGLRYLRLGDVRLVREAHRERRALMRVVAPHIVRRLPFIFPVYENGPHRAFTIQTGLWLYSTLARERLAGSNLTHLYGSLTQEVIDAARDDHALLERLHPDAPDIGAQAVYATAREWACTPEDVLWRRTTLALRGLAPSLPARAGPPVGRT